MGEISKIVGLLILSGTKFFLSPTASLLLGYSYIQTVFITAVGGTLGFFVFFKFGLFLAKLFQKTFKKKEKKRFSKRSRTIVKIKSRYGVYGLAVLAPCILSIPVAAILASIYYSKDRRTVPFFLGSIVIWSIILTMVSSSILII